MKYKNIVVINRGSPELNYIAEGLSQADLLKYYVRPYANQNRWWEETLNSLPGIDHAFQRTFGRRVLPKELNLSLVVETGVFDDFAIAFFNYYFGQSGQKLAKTFENYLSRKLSRVGRMRSKNANIIGSYHYSYAAFGTASGTKILNYPSVHHEYQRKLFTEEKELEPEFASMLSPNWEKMSQRVIDVLNIEIELSDTILTGSNFAKQSFINEAIPANKIRVIPYGTDISLFQPKDNQKDSEENNEFRILYVGRLAQFKGISYLLRAFHKLRGQGLKLTLVGNIIGDGQPLLPYRDIFYYIPHVPRIELPKIYQTADVFVFPSLMEGMPLVVLEAMASGLPVIVTENGPGEVVRDGVDGFVIPIRDEEAIVEKIEYLRTHPIERHQMGKSARKRAEHFSWEFYKKQVLKFLLSNELEKK